MLLAAGDSGFGGFIAGLLMGGGAGFFLGPALRSWIARREWTKASRRARLTDEVLARMDDEVELPPRPPERSTPHRR